MKTYVRSILLPLVSLQVLFKVLNAFLSVIYVHFLHTNLIKISENAEDIALGGSQILLILSPLFLFLAYKYFYKHIIPAIVLLMCFLVSCVGLQWGDPILLNSLRGTIDVILEGILFWQLALLSTSKEKAFWAFPLYTVLASIGIMLLQHYGAWTQYLDLTSLFQLYGVLTVLVTAILIITYQFQSINDLDLRIKDTFLQSFGAIFTSKYFIGPFCILVGSNLIIQLISSPISAHTALFVDILGGVFLILALLSLPSDFFSKKLILGFFALWILGCNFVGFETLTKGIMQKDYNAIFTLYWPTVVLYPLLYRGLLKLDPETRVLGFSYVVICSFLLSRLFLNVLMLI